MSSSDGCVSWLHELACTCRIATSLICKLWLKCACVYDWLTQSNDFVHPAAKCTCRAYRSLNEDERDPEGGNFLPPTAAAQSGCNGAGGDASAGGPAVELSGAGNKSEYSRGITTPTKLQRTVSNNSNADELALTAAGMGTPRSGSPNRQ